MIYERIVSKIRKHGVKAALVSVKKQISFCINKILIRFFRVFPMNEKYIVLESEGDYSDNIKVFSDYLIKNKYTEKYRIVWIVHNTKAYPQYHNVIYVSRYHFINIKTDYYLAVSKYFIFSHPYWFKKVRNNQIIINTTHSVAQLKSPNPIHKTPPFDFILSCSDYCSEIKKHAFDITDKQILTIGMPRLDLLFLKQNIIKKITSRYKGRTIILVMETFKQSKEWNDSEETNPFAIGVVSNDREMDILDDFLGKNNCLLIVKTHHLQDMSYIKAKDRANIIYINDNFLLSRDVTTNDLLRAADVLLTDYSSVFYDYLLLDRPIGFFVNDINKYHRGFIIDNPVDYMPGEKIDSFDGLLEFLKSIKTGKDGYKRKRREERNIVFKYLDNRNCERLYKWIDGGG